MKPHSSLRLWALVLSVVATAVFLFIVLLPEPNNKVENLSGQRPPGSVSRIHLPGKSGVTRKLNSKRIEPIVFSGDFKITADIRSRLQLTPQEVFELQQLMQKTVEEFSSRSSARVKAISSSIGDADQFMLPEDSSFGMEVKNRLIRSVMSVLGDFRGKEFAELFASDSRFAEWGKHETIFTFFDPVARGSSGMVRAVVEERDPFSKQLMRRFEGGADFVLSQYGINFKVVDDQELARSDGEE